MNVSIFDIEIDRINILDIANEGIVLEINDKELNRVAIFFDNVEQANRFAEKLTCVVDTMRFQKYNSTLDKPLDSAIMESDTESANAANAENATNSYEFRDNDHVIRWYGGYVFELFAGDNTVAEETFTYYGDHIGSVPSYEQAREFAFDYLADYATSESV